MTNSDNDSQYSSSTNLSARADMFKRFGAGASAWHRWVFDFLLRAELPPSARIADVGGGPGWFWQLNSDRTPDGWQIVHTDLSPGMVDEARANITRAGSSFKVADAQALPFDDASLDAVVANHMLYHVPDRLCAIAEFARVLKPRGWLVAATNGADHMAEVDAIVDAFNRTHGASLVWPKIGFTLDGGERELATRFVEIEVHRRAPGQMQVTEAETLAGCIASVGAPEAAMRAELLAHLQSLIAAQRVLPIRTQSGLFVARKPLSDS
jgi:ubiquinone/menaquinone biosynthesis C-methylase UbiE